MKLSIIIVNYKTPGLLLNCLETVYAFPNSEVEIIVVDNDSKDNTAELLSKKYPEVGFIQMGYNAGFARANNAGIRIAKGSAVLLLNSDTLVENNAINACLERLLASDYMACGVQLLNEDRTPQISGNYAMKGGLNYLLPLPYTGSLLKAIAGMLKVEKPNVPNATGLVEVDWINGAFLMVKKAAINTAGLLDEDFFLYAEEAEWCSRIKKTGKLCIYGDLHVVHLQGQTANETFQSTGQGYFNLYDRKGLQITLSNFVRIRKQFGVGWFLFILFMHLFTIPVFGIGLLIEKIFRGNKSRYSFKHWKGFVSNMGKITGLVPTIISNRPYFYKVL
jgi:GT2 family glycosyltransferase